MIDPITLEVLRARLMSVVREMTVTLYRTSYSTIIREVRDYSCVIFDREARLVAQAEGVPMFNGALGPVLEGVLNRFSLDEISPGDVFILNDPYEAGGGTHKNDINIVMPIFFAGELVLFSASKAHYTDIGGKDAGSWAADATNCYQEGLMIPPVKLVAAGERNEAVLDLFFANIREKDWSAGDLEAQIAAGRTADRRAVELFEEYDRDTIAAAIDALIEYGERDARKGIEAIPDGEYAGEAFVDGDGVVDESVRLHLTITVDGGEITFDFDGSASQRGGPCGNCSWAITRSVCRETVLFLTGASLSANEGSYRPVHIAAPIGSMVRPTPPHPLTTGVGDVGTRIIELALRLLAPVIPEQVIAGTCGSAQVMSISARDPEGEDGDFVHVSPYGGGWGARASADGNGALSSLLSGDNYNIPCEVMETKFPGLLAEQFALRVGSEGAGRFRGGLGITYDYRMLTDGELSVSVDRYRHPPYGLFGGEEGRGNEIVINPGTESEEQHSKISGYQLPAGSVISHRTAGGGGYGPPFERDPALVLDDVRNEFISAAEAASVYGVKVAEDGRSVDDEATEALRAQSREKEM